MIKIHLAFACVVAAVAWSPPAIGAETAVVPGTRLIYEGDITKDGAGEKSFDLTLLVQGASDEGLRVYWLVDERGQGAWPWSERFGLWTIDQDGQPNGAPGPALLYDYGDDSSSVMLAPPVLKAPVELARSARWQAADLEYEVETAEDVERRDTWRIAVKDRFGRRGTLWVAQADGLIAAGVQRVFMNQGTEYRLKWRLVTVEASPPEEHQALADAFQGLVDLRMQLQRPARETDKPWSDSDLTILSEELPKLAELISDGPLARLLDAARRDVGRQSDEAADVAELRQRQLGTPVKAFEAQSLSGEVVSDKSLSGQVTVLHFWDYRDSPLNEPYGQVGYLEFLHARRQADGVRVIGVAVDGRLRDQSQQGAVKAGIRKLRNFMNLTYPVVLDDGALLADFGDPRRVGANLPLFVVIDPAGTITHYHVGHYEVDPRMGLVDLDWAVSAAAEKTAPAENESGPE